MATHTGSASEAKEYLREEFIGKSLLDLPTPSALLDLSKVKRNCARMLEAVDILQVGWRVHIKTHKVLSFYLCFLLDLFSNSLEIGASGLFILNIRY